MKPIMVEVYGTEIVCASCANLPSSIETKEWLESLLLRKYPEKQFIITHIDFLKPMTEDPTILQFCDEMKEEDRIYPLVKINNKMVSEGQVLVKKLYTVINEL